MMGMREGIDIKKLKGEEWVGIKARKSERRWNKPVWNKMRESREI